jgi:Tfp pilus assembly protein PilO
VSVRRLSPPVQSALVVAAVLAVGVLGYLFLIAPKRSAVADLQKEIDATQVQIDERRTESRGEAAAPPLDVSQLFRVARAMPDEPHIPELILELDRLASRSGISFQSISPQAAVDRDGFRVVPITLVADGKFFNVSNFLGRVRRLVRIKDGKLKASGRLLSVESVSFAEGTEKFPNIKATLSVKAFVYGGGATAAPAGANPETAATTPGAETNPSEGDS